MQAKLAMAANCDPFPAGLRVMVVDDDPICLLILDRLLRRCLYQVTTCEKATAAIDILREKKDCFDLIISDVYMPDMDGFKLLELVGLEMDLPVIMMSADAETSAVMKGINHGACDYLLKPVRIEELMNIWQHVVRKKRRTSDEQASHEAGKHKRVVDDGDCISCENEGVDEVWKPCKKRKDVREEEEDGDDDHSTKKARVVWFGDLHKRFLASVSQLGLDKAVPKRILELMNVPGITREHVASHLQKFRLYMKRTSAVWHPPGGLNTSFAGSPDTDYFSVCGLGRSQDLSTFAVTGSPQSPFSTLQTGLSGSLAPPNNFMRSVDPSLLPAALQLANASAIARPLYSQAFLSNQGNLMVGGPSDMKQFGSSQQLAAIEQMANKRPTGVSALQQELAGATGLGGMDRVSNSLQDNPNAWMMQALQQHAGGHLTSAEENAVFGSNTVVQNAHLLRPGSPSNVVFTGSSSPDTFPKLGGTSCAGNNDIKHPNAEVSFPVQSPGVSSPLALSGLDIDLGASRTEMNGLLLNGVSEHSRHTFSSFASNVASLTGMRDEPGLNKCLGVGQKEAQFPFDFENFHSVGH